MTENKRFVAIGVEWTDGFIQDHISDRDLFNIGAVCNLLNDLSEENEQLKQQLEHIQGIFSIINGYLQDEGVLTLEKYTEIEDYIYDQWKKGDVE